MAERRVSSVLDDDEDKTVYVVDDIGVLNILEGHEEVDDFKKPARVVKSMDGAGPVFKRRVSRELKKVREGVGGAESKQIHEEDSITGYEAFEVVEPLYNLDYLAKLYDRSPHHNAACNAKVSNIVGLGYKLVENAKTKANLEKNADDEEKLRKLRRNLNAHRQVVLDDIDKLNKEDSFTETLTKVWRDYEATGNGYIEIGRKKDGDEIGYIGHIPATTIRIRKERDGFVQMSGFKVQFFAQYGAGFDDDGNKQPIKNPVGNDVPNEVIHIYKYSPTSGYYGVPDIISALQAVAGNEMANRFNLDYFENKAVPRYAIILKGAKLGKDAEKRLLSFFQTGLKGENHRSIVIPLPGDTEDNKVSLEFEAIEAGVQDSSFNNYRKANLADILMAHRVPITKISVSEGAALAVARDADKTFKEQVCEPEQNKLEKKLNRIIKELTDAFDIKLDEMSLTDENTQSQIDERRRKTGVETANEQRARRGEPWIEGGDELFDMNAAVKVAEMGDKTTRRGQDKQEAQAKEGIKAQAEARAAAPAAGANANGNPKGTRQRDTERSANATDSAGQGRNPKGEGRTTA